MTARLKKPPVPQGFEILNELQPLKPVTTSKRAVSSDQDVFMVKAALEESAGGEGALVRCLASVLRRSLDQSYNGAQTGRFHLAQLSKTEKAHTGSLFEIELQKTLDLPDGHDTDYQVLGMDLDAKFTHSRKGAMPSWMIGPEIEGNIALLATADDYSSVWSAWLVWVTPGRRNAGRNRDAKASLNVAGRKARIPIAEDSPLPPNDLLQRPADAYEVMRHQGQGRGQKRILELCRRFEGTVLSRTTVATVAQQLDPVKRMRANGGARTRLAAEGFLVLGHESGYVPVAKALGLPMPYSGEFLPLRVSRAEVSDPEPHFLDRYGARWRRARVGEVTREVPDLVI
ncbi:NaeI family type II restriction endonuclease [Paractinoplanes rhizophilus]|uniref:NaeI family type II restriction endonuclease n=1 Tax=Paractinoplanes rhizophilus TaxID=1416877 RepID=A0ABW2HYI9_9ACTN